MKKNLNKIGRVPMPQLILWWVIRFSLLGFSIFGILHGSTTQFLMGLFAVAFTHMWDMWQLFGGKSFITRVGYFPQTLLNIFIGFGVVIGYFLNTKTNFQYTNVIEHFMAGVVAAYFAYDFAVVFQGKSRHLSPALASMFALTFAVFISVAWEFYEFTEPGRPCGYHAGSHPFRRRRAYRHVLRGLFQKRRDRQKPKGSARPR